jgi:hypothetical protein
MKDQIVQFHSLTLDGSVFSETQGCLPASLLQPNQQPLPCMPVTNRAVEFDFRGPVMFNLIAVDENGKTYEQLVKLKIQGMSLKVGASLTNAGYPRFGSGSIDSLQNIEFERAFGIFEIPGANGSEDGRINETQTNQVLANLFPVGDPFLLSSNNPNESLGFGARRGGNFPFLDPGFLFNTPEGAQFQGNRTNSDALIYGGTFGVDGTIEVIKGDNGDVEVITPKFRNYEPFFVQIDLRSTDTQPQRVLISDVHIGNVSQGLVLSTFRGHISPLAPPTVGVYELTVDTSQVPLLSTGNVKGALCGFNVSTVNGNDFLPAQATVSVEWINIPIFPDNDISGLRNTYIRFTQ